jgi:hypothetical protein
LGKGWSVWTEFSGSNIFLNFLCEFVKKPFETFETSFQTTPQLEAFKGFWDISFANCRPEKSAQV